jgi:hypothetical protein
MWGTFQPGMPFYEYMDDHKKFFIIDFVVEFLRENVP